MKVDVFLFAENILGKVSAEIVEFPKEEHFDNIFKVKITRSLDYCMDYCRMDITRFPDEHLQTLFLYLDLEQVVTLNKESLEKLLYTVMHHIFNSTNGSQFLKEVMFMPSSSSEIHLRAFTRHK